MPHVRVPGPAHSLVGCAAAVLSVALLLAAGARDTSAQPPAASPPRGSPPSGPPSAPVPAFRAGRYTWVLTDEDTGGRLPAGAWEVRFLGDSTTEVWDPIRRRMLAARYVVQGDTLIVRDAAGPLACPPATGPAPDAVYTWRLDGERLTLRTLQHPCAGQSGAVLGMTRQPDAPGGATPARSAAVQHAGAPSGRTGFPAGRYGVTVRDADAHGPFVAGRWELRFGPDGRSALRDPQGTIMVEGTYAVRGDTLLLTDVSGPLSCAQAPEFATAILTWVLAGPRLLLHTVDDPCEGRQQAFAGMNAAGFVRIPDAARDAGRERAHPAPSTPPREERR